MTLDHWLTIAAIGISIAGGIITALILHAREDARTKADLRALQNRVKKLDGIDANGH